MASRTYRPQPYDPEKDPVILQYRKAAEEQALANDLVNNEGYDARQMQDFRRRGGDVKTLVSRPKPMLTPQEQEMEVLKRRAEAARLKRSIMPSQQEEDRDTGQMFDATRSDDGQIVRTPQRFTSGAARYRPKPEGFKGTTEEGDEWAMDRDEFGAATDYRITKPHTDKIIKFKKADGSVVNARQRITDNGVELEELDTKLDGGKVTMGKADDLYETPYVKGKKKRSDKGEWTPDPETFEPSDAIKKTYGNIQRELNGVNQALVANERDYARYPNKETKEKINGLLKHQGFLEGKLAETDEVVKAEAGERILHKLRGFKEGEMPKTQKGAASSTSPQEFRLVLPPPGPDGKPRAAKRIPLDQVESAIQAGGKLLQ
jgi:hypothetical protein